jgi:uncharacterized integral membrane protein
MKRIIYLIVLMLVVFWLASFISVNLQEVEIKWFIGRTLGRIPLIIVILGSVLLGALLTALVGGFSQTRLLSQNRQQRRTIKNLEQELSALDKASQEAAKKKGEDLDFES